MANDTVDLMMWTSLNNQFMRPNPIHYMYKKQKKPNSELTTDSKMENHSKYTQQTPAVKRQTPKSCTNANSLSIQ